MKIGVSLLTCNLASHPEHLQSLEWMWSSFWPSLPTLTSELQVVIYDDGSTCQDTIGFIQGLRGKDVEVMLGIRRQGIARARNQSYQRLLDWGADYLIDLHPDMVFPTGWLPPLLERMTQHPRLGIISPGIITSWEIDGSPVLENLYQDTYEVGVDRVEKMSKLLVQQYHRSTRLVYGITHPDLKRSDMLREVGLYPEDMPSSQNFEDTEEIYRAEKKGWGVGVTKQSWVYHHVALSRKNILAQEAGVSPHDADRTSFLENQAYCRNLYGTKEWDQWFRVFCLKQSQIFRKDR